LSRFFCYNSGTTKNNETGSGGELLSGAEGVEFERTSFFPLFIDMQDKKVLVTGGGRVAERRIEKLLPFGVDITVISPKVTEYIESE